MVLVMDRFWIEVVFDTMRRERERWIRGFSGIVDCVYAALSDGGIVREEKKLEPVTV